MNIRDYLIFLLITVIGVNSSAQDVSAFGSKANYNLSGGVNIGSQFYHAIGDSDPRLASFGYRVNGNLNARLGAITIPVSFSFNHINGSIATPFNLYGASPYYKWIKLHVGFRSLSFNPYTYSGKAFNGIGVSLTPGAFELTTFIGKIRNPLAIRDTIIAGAIELTVNERRIQGVKIGAGKRSTNISLSAVRVKDDFSLQNTGIDPVENIALGMQGEVRIWNRIKLKANVGTSIFTGDQVASSPELTSDFERQVQESITINSTTRLSFAGDAFIGYDRRGYKVGLKYKRVDPFYTSLGINYIQNDIENYTLNAGAPFLRKRLRLRGSIGLQNDNLKGQKAFTSKRLIGSLSANYIPNKKISLQARFSNYQHQNVSGLVVVNDTLKILTTTRSISLGGVGRILDNTKYRSSINVNVFRNNVIDEARIEGGNIFTSNGAILRCDVELKSLKLTFGPSLNYNNFTYSESEQGRVGGGIRVSHKMMEDKWFNSLNVVVNQNTYDGKSNGRLTNINLSSRYKFNKTHNMNVRLFYINNDVILSDGYEEFRGSLSYGFIFR